ncbi:perlucin-like protein [Mytilus edulis]|uniref:perlucin-like protein n=1 Tax=Mytilus edulis TaxID=6550 RepID=UPI0039F0CAEF
MENNVKKTTDVLKNNLRTLQSTLHNMGQKIKKLDTDFKVLGKDFRNLFNNFKYDGHCYYYSVDKKDWFTVERKCSEIGGYFAKLDSTAENNEIYSNADKNNHYWIGLTDLKEGEFRWTYDQSKAEVKNWHPSYGKIGTNNNCVAISYHANKLHFFDYTCSAEYRYICESNFCF